MDNGYYSFDNVEELLYHRFNVTILVKTGLNWVKDAIDDHYSEFGKPSTYCCCDDKENLMSGVTVKLKLLFITYANTATEGQVQRRRTD